MLPDWVLLIFLFVGIALVPLYEPRMTPLGYLAGGLGNLFQSVGAFFGLVLLAILLLATGVLLLLGFETVQGRFAKGPPQAPQTTGSDGAERNESSGVTRKRKLRPYQIAKARGQSHNDQMLGLLLVLAGLALLWIVPSYFMSLKKQPRTPVYEPPRQDDTYTQRDKVTSSQAGQGLLGVLTLVILVASFAMLKPEKHAKTEKLVNPGLGRP